MGPHEDRVRAKNREVCEQRLAILHVRVVWLIIAEEPPGGTQRPSGPGGVERDGDGGLGRLPTSRTEAKGKQGRDRNQSESHDGCPSRSRISSSSSGCEMIRTAPLSRSSSTVRKPQAAPMGIMPARRAVVISIEESPR